MSRLVFPCPKCFRSISRLRWQGVHTPVQHWCFSVTFEWRFLVLGLELLSPPPWCWDFKCASPHLLYLCVLGIEIQIYFRNTLLTEPFSHPMVLIFFNHSIFLSSIMKICIYLQVFLMCLLPVSSSLCSQNSSIHATTILPLSDFLLEVISTNSPCSN